MDKCIQRYLCAFLLFLNPVHEDYKSLFIQTCNLFIHLPFLFTFSQKILVNYCTGSSGNMLYVLFSKVHISSYLESQFIVHPFLTTQIIFYNKFHFIEHLKLTLKETKYVILDNDFLCSDIHEHVFLSTNQPQVEPRIYVRSPSLARSPTFCNSK